MRNALRCGFLFGVIFISMAYLHSQSSDNGTKAQEDLGLRQSVLSATGLTASVPEAIALKQLSFDPSHQRQDDLVPSPANSAGPSQVQRNELRAGAALNGGFSL